MECHESQILINAWELNLECMLDVKRINKQYQKKSANEIAQIRRTKEMNA